MSAFIYLFDTYRRKKVVFSPIKRGEVKMYTCGPTVYDFPHIGNLRAYIFSDVLRRIFEFNGYRVFHVINITDVGHLVSDDDFGEDKIELSAIKQKRSAFEIAEFYTDVFKQNIADLNIKSPMIWSKATDNIEDQIDLIKKLEKKGYTYITPDGVYFNTSLFPNYGRLARLNVEGIRPGARVDLREKKNPTDFALWKFSPKNKKRQMEWQSPWGVGFPGWHIECSAMAMKYLGETIDVHTGGIDHIPVHHTNEIAQSEAVTKKKFVNYWMHVDFLLVEGKKMSKSKGNFTTLNDLVKKGYDPIAFRYLVLTSHYRAGLNFTWEGIHGAQKTLTSLRERFLSWNDSEKEGPDPAFLQRFKKAVNDDVSTPKAIALLWELVNSSLGSAKKRATILEFDKVLGLGLSRAFYKKIPDEVMVLVKKREELRRKKEFKEADCLRRQITRMGYEVRDTEDGVKVIKIV